MSIMAMLRKRNNLKPQPVVTLETIHSDLQRLNANFARQFSMRHIIWTSIIRGLFTAIGATFVLSVLLIVVSAVYNTLNDVPFFRDLFQNTQIEQVIEKK